jgi:hypothetical protein
MVLVPLAIAQQQNFLLLTPGQRRPKSQDNVSIRKIRLDHGHVLERKSSVHRAFKGGGRSVPPNFNPAEFTA